MSLGRRIDAEMARGYENVAHLDGGLNAWKAAGQPVATDAAA
jgi:rhodanese-related sulfurtransferase